MLLRDSFISTECPTGIDENLFLLFRRTALKLMLGESTKSLHSIASYFWPRNSIRPAILLQQTSEDSLSNVNKYLKCSRYQQNVVPGASRCFSRRREPSSWAAFLGKVQVLYRVIKFGLGQRQRLIVLFWPVCTTLSCISNVTRFRIRTRLNGGIWLRNRNIWAMGD